MAGPGHRIFLVSMAAVGVTWLLGAALNEYVGMLSWVGAAYLLWMAWHMLRSSGLDLDHDPAAPPSVRGCWST